MNQIPVRTRFAPSPTGYMHLGGMRTALFNWVFARHHGGQFILRIDDTDRERNISAALEPILNAFRWLEMDWDEGPEIDGPHGPYFQSQRDKIYQEYCKKLLDIGLAYRDFDPPELVKADRESAEKEKRQYLNIRRSLDLSASKVEQKLTAGDPYVIRLLVPRDQKIVIDDAVRGQVEFDAGLITDPVIVRGNGTPLYNFASVVDDAQMQISHVIRAEEHLSNTPIQALLFDALEFERPQFAHIPFVAAPGSKEKLSKRKLEKYRKSREFKKLFDAGDLVFPLIGLENEGGLDPVMVEYYEKIGYLPEALFNNLARLGWSLDDQTEIMSRDTIIQNFTLDRVVKSAAGFDPDKLNSLQAHWIGELSLEQKVQHSLPYLQQANYVDEQTSLETISQIVEQVGERLIIFSDILKFDEFFVPDEDLKYNEKDFQKRIVKPEGMLQRLQDLKRLLADSTPEQFRVEPLHENVSQYVEENELKMGPLVNALRVAVTGKGTGIGLFEAIELIGQQSCLKRIDQAIELASSSGNGS